MKKLVLLLIISLTVSSVSLYCQAFFTSDVQVAYIGGTVQFTSQSIGATTWLWDFGDGSPTSLLENPSHIYSSSSRFDVTLTINGGSSTLTRTQYIQVLPNRGTPYVVATDGGTFETNPDDFGSQSISGGVNKWERGVPSNFLVTVNSPVNVWKTDLDADLGFTSTYYACALQTPSYNFTSSASAYTLRFRRSMEIVFCNGPYAVQVQYTTDRGQTWTRLGVNADPASTNWYNRGPATGCPVDVGVFPDQYGWTVTSNNSLCTYNLTTGVPSLIGQPEVAFRIVIAVAGGYAAGGYAADGFMIDDFEILGPVNSPFAMNSPIAVDDSGPALTEDGPNGTVNIITNDTDPDGNPSAPINGVGQFTVDLDPGTGGIQTTFTDAQGVWTLNTATGVVTFDPANNYNGTAIIPYTLCDPTGLCDPANITFVVTPVNDPPVANDDNGASLMEDGPNGFINILTNDLDPDGNPTAPVNGIGQFFVDMDPGTGGTQTTFTDAQGVWTLNTSTGVVTFDPANNYNGTAVISYTLCDPTGLCDPANISFVVTPVNDPPVANVQTVNTFEDTPTGITLTGSDPDSDPITYTISSMPGHGSLSGTAPNLTYIPAVNYFGTDVMQFITNDGIVNSAPATVTIIVAPVNDPPIANSQSVSTPEDSPLAITLTGSDVEGGPLTYTVVSGPSQGSLSGTAPNLTYTPPANYNGVTSFTFRIMDSSGSFSGIATVTITVIAINDPPVANNDNGSALTEDGPNGAVNILTNDTDPDGNPTAPVNGVGQFIVDMDPGTGGIQTTFSDAQGVWTLNTATGVVTFDPANNYNGTAVIPYSLCDPTGLCDPANITFVVTPVNDPPVANDDNGATLMEDGPNGFINILTNDLDPDGNPTAPVNGIGQFFVDMDPGTGGTQTSFTDAQGVWTLNTATGFVTFDPANNYNGTAMISYTLCDPSGMCDPANITFVVTPVNDPPIAVCQNLTGYLNTSGSFSIIPAMLNNGSTDDNGIVSMTVNPTSLSCANIGTNNVTLTVFDGSGLSSQCTSIVTIIDSVRPIASCQNATVYLSTSGTGLVTPALINLGSSDNCGISSFSISPSGLIACNRIGTTAFTLGVQDISANFNSCISMVTVLDTIRPIVNTQNISVTLVGGTASITASMVNNGSTDNCSIASMSVSPNTFNCANLGPNTVTLTVTDNSGNVSTRISVVTVFGAAIASTTSTTICAGQNGTITASGNGTYSWSTGATTASITQSPATTTVYTVTVTSPQGCTATALGTINVNQNPIASSSATSILCNGGSSTVTVIASGGTPTYTGTGTFPVTAGTYSYPVTDANGCASTTTITITEPTLLTTSSSATSILCNGGSSTVTIIASGGTPTYTGTGTFSVTSGTYSYPVNDANGCAATTTITITEPTLLTTSSSATSILCNGGSSTVTVIASGGTPTYTGTGTFTVTAGTYSYPVTDANGCASTTTVTVTEPTLLTSTSSATPINCNGETGFVTVDGFGGTTPYTGTGLFQVSAGTYSYTVTDFNGCTSITTIVLTQPTAVTGTSTLTNVSCFGGVNGSIDLTPSGGTGPYTYSWNSGTYLTEDISGLTIGNYTCTVTDAIGCRGVVIVGITEPIALLASVTTSTNPTTCSGTDGAIDISVSGGTGAYTFLWSDGATSEDLSAVSAGAYMCTITDANGCTTTVNANLNDPNAPTVTLNVPMDTVCQTTQLPFLLTGESPSGGTFAGAGVTGNTFDPMVASIGFNMISYTYTDVNGCTGSTVDSIYVDLCLDVQGAVANTDFTIMPNPNNGMFAFILNSDEAADVMIYNSIGQLITKLKAQPHIQQQMIIENSGVYLITVITADGQRSTQRVVVNE